MDEILSLIFGILLILINSIDLNKYIKNFFKTKHRKNFFKTLFDEPIIREKFLLIKCRNCGTPVMWVTNKFGLKKKFIYIQNIKNLWLFGEYKQSCCHENVSFNKYVKPTSDEIDRKFIIKHNKLVFNPHPETKKRNRVKRYPVVDDLRSSYKSTILSLFFIIFINAYIKSGFLVGFICSFIIEIICKNYSSAFNY